MCFNSTGCSFMRCRGTNIPVDLSQLKLGSSIGSCGAITLPGHYALTGSINMGSLVNISADIRYNLQCINITSSDVSLDCRNFSIYNSTAGIAAYNESNVSISNCNIRNSNSGIKLAGTKSSTVSNATMRNDVTGLMLTNSSGDMLSNVKAYSGTYGTYLLSSSSDTFQGFNFSNNLYGIYIDHSIGETFSNGAAVNNLQDDVYATPDSANTGYSLMLSSSCGLTNANWASCSQHSVANLSNYPLTRCTTISRPGNYTLTSNIVNAPSGCVNITASGVSLNCMSHSIIADAPNFAAGFYVANEKNVSINNCYTLNFRTGVEARDSSNVRVTGSSLISGHYGVAFYNVSNSKVFNNTMAGTFNASILLSNVTNSVISYNNATYGRHESAGILLDNSSGNRLLNNTLFTNYVGMRLEGASVNNLVNNNTAMFSAVHDYSCNDTSAGFNSNYGGIDYGSTKLGCRWMAVLLESTPQAPCSSFDDQPAQIQLTNDALYRLNATCFDVYTTDTKINCNGHTIIATNNGSFDQFKDSANTGLLNCFLKGFTDPISVINSSAAILNNTISGNATGTAISIIDSALAKVQGNNITYAHRASGPYGTGISINNSEAGYLLNNRVNGAGTAYLLNNVSSFQITNDTATATDSLGMYLNGSMTNQFYANNFLAKTTGLQCKSTSQGSTSNFDNGGTTCTSNSGCAWIKSSALTCHS